MYFPLFVGVLCLSLFCYALLCVHSSFAIILKRKRKLGALLLLTCRRILTINVLYLFFTVLVFGLQCVIVVFPDHIHLFFVCAYVCLCFSVYSLGVGNKSLVIMMFSMVFPDSVNSKNSCLWPSEKTSVCALGP